MKPVVVILALACVGLAAQLFFRNSRGQKAERELSAVVSHAQALSNEVVEARSKLEEEARLAAYLQSNLTSRATDLAVASNTLNQAASSLAAAQTDLKI